MRGSGAMRWIALSIVVLHAIVIREHDVAHGSLGVHLSLWQQAFVYPVIVVAPFVAAALLLTRQRRTGFLVLSASMLGSLAFGVYHHYIGISPDHVSHLPPGDAQPAFRATALLMAVIEAAGALVGARGARAASAVEAAARTRRG